MTREQLLKPKAFEIKLPDGEIVHARKLKQSEFEKVAKEYQGEDKLMDGLRFIVCRCALDEAGNRLFTDDDTAAVNDMPADALQTIGVEVMKASGLKTAARGNA